MILFIIFAADIGCGVAAAAVRIQSSGCAVCVGICLPNMQHRRHDRSEVIEIDRTVSDLSFQLINLI